jgi:hypothetical protein
MFDYFDAGIMEGLQHRLVNMTEVQTQGNVANASGNAVCLHSKVGRSHASVRMLGKEWTFVIVFP